MEDTDGGLHPAVDGQSLDEDEDEGAISNEDDDDPQTEQHSSELGSGGRNSSDGSVSGSLSCLMQRRGFDPPLGRKFPLELTWVLTRFPLNSFGWEYKQRSSLCTHAFHRMDSKDPDVHILDAWMPVTKTPSMHHPRRRKVTTSMVGLKSGHIRKKSHPQNGEPQRSSWERRRRRRVGSQWWED